MTKVEVLKITLKELNRRNKAFVGLENKKRYFGLCAIVGSFRKKGVISYRDSISFNKLLHRSHKNQTVFYTCDAEKTDDSLQFHWKFGKYAPRKIWLEEQIKKLS